MRVHVVDPPLFTLPYDQHFCRALAAAGAEVTLIGRGLRTYEEIGPEPFAFAPLFYRRSENAATDWRTSRMRQALKGAEHLLGLRALQLLAGRDRPDIVHLQWFVLPFFDRFLFRRLGRDAGLVLTVHDSISLHGARNASRLQLVGDREARLMFDHFIVHTEQTRIHLGELGVDAAKVTVLPHPPLSLATAYSTVPAAQREGPPQVLFFGSIKGYKGVDVLVDAGLALAAEGRDFVINVAGRPFDPVDALEAKIAAAGADRHFNFDLRYIPENDLADYVRTADLIVFPYRRIDASGALAVAIEAGKPVIASEIGVFAEEPTRRHLRLVQPGDPVSLAQALRELIGDPAARATLAEGTQALKAGMRAWPDFAQACLAVYEQVRRRAA